MNEIGKRIFILVDFFKSVLFLYIVDLGFAFVSV